MTNCPFIYFKVEVLFRFISKKFKHLINSVPECQFTSTYEMRLKRNNICRCNSFIVVVAMYKMEQHATNDISDILAFS